MYSYNQIKCSLMTLFLLFLTLSLVLDNLCCWWVIVFYKYIYFKLYKNHLCEVHNYIYEGKKKTNGIIISFLKSITSNCLGGQRWIVFLSASLKEKKKKRKKEKLKKNFSLRNFSWKVVVTRSQCAPDVTEEHNSLISVIWMEKENDNWVYF